MLMEKEYWKPVIGYETYYEVSNYGRVRSLNYYGKTGKTVILHQKKLSSGYMMLQLSKNNKQKDWLVHILVAKAFIQNPDNYPCVNHKDENRANNNVDNLEWCTYGYNNNYGTRNEKISKALTGRKMSEKTKKKVSKRKKGIPNFKKRKKVYQYTLDNQLVKVWESARETNKDGFSYKNISQCCNGKRKTHKGYKWSFEPL